MTITLFRPILLPAPRRATPPCELQEAHTLEFDENGRQYVFRFPPFVPKRYLVARDRLFQYMRAHKLPGIAERRIARDQRNTANFFEDIRELQTSAEVFPIETIPPLRISAAS